MRETGPGERIFNAVLEIKNRGERVTARKVLALSGGSLTTISKYIKQYEELYGKGVSSDQIREYFIKSGDTDRFEQLRRATKEREALASRVAALEAALTAQEQSATEVVGRLMAPVNKSIDTLAHHINRAESIYKELMIMLDKQRQGSAAPSAPSPDLLLQARLTQKEHENSRLQQQLNTLIDQLNRLGHTPAHLL